MRQFVALAGILILVIATAGAAMAAGKPRAARLDNAGEVFPESKYVNTMTAAVTDAHGSVVTPAAGANSPACKITAIGLLPSTTYQVYVDTDGITPADVNTAGVWVQRGSFTTNRGGNGTYTCSESIGDGSAVFINDEESGLTVLISPSVNDG